MFNKEKLLQNTSERIINKVWQENAINKKIVVKGFAINFRHLVIISSSNRHTSITPTQTSL